MEHPELAGSLSLTEMLAHFFKAIKGDNGVGHDTRMAAAAVAKALEVMDEVGELIVVQKPS